MKFVVLFASLTLAQSTLLDSTVTQLAVNPAAPTTRTTQGSQPSTVPTQATAQSNQTSIPFLNTIPHAFLPCTQPRLREDIRDLTSAQRLLFITAFLQVHKSGKLDDLISMHGNRMTGKLSPIHFTSQFFPWHRLYLLDLEDRLIASGAPLWPNFGLPYWDNSLDSQHPHLSVVFTADYLGANDQGPSKSGQIINSPLQNYQFTTPLPHLITRGYQGNISQFVHSSVLQAQYMAEDQSFSKFAQSFENYPHALIHSLIAGDFSSWSSPNDPLFFLHHGFLDKCWADWQAKGSNLMKFDGAAYNNAQNSLSDQIKDYNVPISYTMNTSTLCFTYAPVGSAAMNLSVDAGISIIKPPSKLPDSWFNMSSVPGLIPNRSAINILIGETAVTTKQVNNATMNVLSGGKLVGSGVTGLITAIVLGGLFMLC